MKTSRKTDRFIPVSEKPRCAPHFLPRRSIVRVVTESARIAVAGSLIACMLSLSVGTLNAQQAPDSPPQSFQLGSDELDQLVAPIALYPDALVAQVLIAATFAPQISEADGLVQANAELSPQGLAQLVDTQLWDPSVKALTAFPSVLANLIRNMQWTARLGDAYYNQPQDVMSAVQAMRQRAYAAGTLQSTPQETVAITAGY
jgi:hypothetical protein